MGLETIIPFLQPIAHLIIDPEISEIMINGDHSIFIQRAGCLVAVDAYIEQKYLANAVKRIARSLGDDIGENRPLLDARLPDGSRVAAAFPPCSIGGITLTIRKFRQNWFTLAELVTAGALSGAAAEYLIAAVRDRRTILISGGTDTGKTTFATALLQFIPENERMAVIEDTLELKVDHPNAIRLETRNPETDAEGNITVHPVTIRQLVKATLRHRPDRLIIGEVRGGEAFDLIDALNTGHGGSISTIHANSATLALTRLASLAMRANVDIPYRALQTDIGQLIDLVVHVERRDGVRRVAEILNVERFDPDLNCYETNDFSAS